MASVEDYCVLLLNQLNKQRNETVRHIFFMVCATDPLVMREHPQIAELMEKIEEDENHILYRLNADMVQGIFDGEVKYFKDIDSEDQYREYLTTKLFRPLPNLLENLVLFQKNINKNYRLVVSLCLSNNLFLERPNVTM